MFRGKNKEQVVFSLILLIVLMPTTSGWWRSNCDQKVACVQSYLADEAWMHKTAGVDGNFLTSRQ